MSKECTKCRETQLLDAFHRDKGKRDGRMAICKGCRKRSRDENPSKYREQGQKSYAKHAEKRRAEYRVWAEKNREHLRQYRQENRGRRSAYAKAYRENHQKEHDDWYAANRDTLLQKKRDRYRENPAPYIQRAARNRRENPDKTRAGALVNNAIRKGQLMRSPCEVCGTDERVDAHHDDYTRPLDVRWLCRSHHLRWHAKHGEARR